ncbi:hypothetical protein COV93_07000 [Candidatus Woesearchaeota archaeon CG11_big_fil_rev_8_21_14_0_20_43_8]|nr:MAG: hypothetical protein COV93_07000 [Candidatus Woesearchaeota archaeon CG11_big_fil_rev_8_21_14_0_20_43_8]PIO04938.1 MAG: hypothetical protein COT47_06835 [Candidatus Woesearchaeota archaeon CG08_land_8_20_14_0_20_43_7]
MMEGKDFFMGRYKEMCGEEVPSITERKSIRVNTLKIDEATCVERLRAKGVVLEKISFTDNGYWISDSKFSLGSTPEYLLGLYYLQEAAAQVPVRLLAPHPEDIVLDMCAAPGGKTTQIAQMMQNKGTIIATEPNRRRLDSLKYILQRMGVSNTLVYKKDGRDLSELRMSFDKILLDAPCSGNFISDNEWFNKRDMNGIKRCAELQEQLISKAAAILDKDGILVYSTCSMEPEENESIVSHAVNELGLALCDIDLPLSSPGITSFQGRDLTGMDKCRRFWPHRSGTQGFFVAKLRKL